MNAPRGTEIDGITMAVSAACLHVEATRPLRVVSTAAHGAGLAVTRHFLSIRAPADLDCLDPSLPLEAAARDFGILEPFVGFLTAVKLTNVVCHLEHDGARKVAVITTVGVRNASRPGEEVANSVFPGTINTIVLIDADLSLGALTEALSTTVEAKALAVYERGVRTKSGLPATGTSTDAYAVACTGQGTTDRYAGSVSPLGYLVGRTVRSAVEQGLDSALARLAWSAR